MPLTESPGAATIGRMITSTFTPRRGLVLTGLFLGIVAWLAAFDGLSATRGQQSPPPPPGNAAAPAPRESSADKDRRMAWWRDARFGMFIHWGLYSVPAGEWGNRTDHAEWIRTTAQIPIAEYDKLLAKFNPVKFDADAWARMAKDAGMKYIVITSKHHDGFALFDSKVSDFDVMATPFHRDILKELSEACQRQGLKMCFYHSIMDWHHPDYLPRRDWEKDRSAEGADFKRFETYLHSQVTELLTHYGPIGVLWFDGEWENTWTHEYGQPLYDLCRKLQPDVIVNNRVDKGRGGMAGMTEDAMYAGDFGTPEQEVPGTGIAGVDWESCITMNNNWGYNKADKNFKSPRDLIRMLVDIASKGGNLLLNIGPTSEGEFPPESVERLAAIGKWMKINGESIYGTQAGPFPSLPWGRCTMKPMGENTRLYLHVFDWPADGKLSLPGLANELKGASVLAESTEEAGKHGATLNMTLELEQQKSGEAWVFLPKTAPDVMCSVVALDIAGKPIVYETPTITAPSTTLVTKLPVEVKVTSTELEIRYTLDGSAPTPQSPKAAGPVIVDRDATLTARSFHAGKAVSGAATMSFTKVAPWPAVSVPKDAKPTFAMRTFTGNWDKLPDFASLKATKTEERPDIALKPADRIEYVGYEFTGVFRAPVDELYVFALTSDDGANLEVDGKKVVDNDGLHGSLEKRGTAPLAAGSHNIRVTYFNKTGGSDLSVRMGAVGQALAPLSSAPK